MVVSEVKDGATCLAIHNIKNLFCHFKMIHYTCCSTPQRLISMVVYWHWSSGAQQLFWFRHLSEPCIHMDKYGVQGA